MNIRFSIAGGAVAAGVLATASAVFAQAGVQSAQALVESALVFPLVISSSRASSCQPWHAGVRHQRPDRRTPSVT